MAVVASSGQDICGPPAPDLLASVAGGQRGSWEPQQIWRAADLPFEASFGSVENDAWLCMLSDLGNGSICSCKLPGLRFVQTQSPSFPDSLWPCWLASQGGQRPSLPVRRRQNAARRAFLDSHRCPAEDGLWLSLFLSLSLLFPCENPFPVLLPSSLVYRKKGNAIPKARSL